MLYEVKSNTVLQCSMLQVYYTNIYHIDIINSYLKYFIN